MAGGFREKLVSGWRKKIQEKTQDGPKTHCSIASANSLGGANSDKPCFPCYQDSANTHRSEPAASSAIATPPILRSTTNSPDVLAPAVPPAPLSTATPASPSKASDKVEETHPVGIKGQALDTGEGPTAGVSLWDRAYDVLKDEEPDRVTEYEQLLSRVLIRGTLSTPC